MKSLTIEYIIYKMVSCVMGKKEIHILSNDIG